MKVVHIDEAQHAVLGGEQGRRFRTADSPEFFKMAIDAYQNKPMATVREVLCNGWDEHIKAGITDVPLKVTLDHNYLTIRDYGPGIPDKDMETVYCTIGKSTKAADEEQTGGFGLGSKAPFTYTDFFSVTSNHDGQKSVYAVSKGSEESEGFPEIRRMAAVPTEDSGLEVQVPLNDASDRQMFAGYVKQVTADGGMLIELNGEVLPRWDFSEAYAHGFAVSSVSHPMYSHAVKVKVGAVVYPLNRSIPEIGIAYTKLFSALPNFRGTLLLFAQGGTVGIAPSREALSYTPKTIACLVKMMAKVRHELTCREGRVTASVIKDIARKKDPMKMGPRVALDHRPDKGGVLLGIEEITEHWVRSNVAENPDQTIRYLVREWARTYPHLRGLKLPKECVPSDLYAAVNKKARKRVALAVHKAGVPGKLNYVYQYSVRPLKSKVNNHFDGTKVYVAERHKDVTEGPLTPSPSPKKPTMCVFVKKLPPEDFKSLKTELAKYGLEAEYIPRKADDPKPKTEKAEPSSLEVRARFSVRSGYGLDAKYRGKKLAEDAPEPKFYAAARKMASGLKFEDSGVHRVINEVADLYGPLAMATNKTKVKQAEALGYRNVVEAMGIEMQGAKDSVEFRIGYFNRKVANMYTCPDSFMQNWWELEPKSLLKYVGLPAKRKINDRNYLLGGLHYRLGVHGWSGPTCIHTGKDPAWARYYRIAELLHRMFGVSDLDSKLGSIEKPEDRELYHKLFKTVLNYHKDAIEKGLQNVG